MHDSVTVHFNASPKDVWSLVSDVTRIGEYSPETFEAKWIDGATGPELGAEFRGHVKRNEKGPTYWTTCRVSECERERVFAFEVLTNGKALNTWGYRLEEADGGTDVTESFQLADTFALRVYWKALGWARGKRNHNDMQRTLERMRDQLASA